MIGQDRFHLVKQFLPSGVLTLVARERVEMTGLNFMDEFHRIAGRRNQIEPPPRHQFAGRQSQPAVSKWIAMMMIVKKPGVQAPLAERFPYGGKTHWQATILRNRSVLTQ